ncbi:MAG: beta-eliminating lyase-related protein [Pseudomonadota bacterium]|nr:beta-eliminating lyase-related protein [Pseudomonadota bacterium]
MNFESDNAARVHPAAMRAIACAADARGSYDGDRWSGQLNAEFSRVFERAVEVLWVATGTAANALALGVLCPPYGGIICHEESHILTDECGASGFFTGGATLLAQSGPGAKLIAADVRAALALRAVDQHTLPVRCLSITNASEWGQVYTQAEVEALGAVCREFGLRFHMDGARFANAVAFLGCSPADLSWRAGVDLLAFGFAKNGALMGEALVIFDPSLTAELRYRRKRAGHLPARGRMIAAQLLALVEDDLWLANARASNRAAQLLGEGAGARLAYPVEANEVFVTLSAGEAQALRQQGFSFHDWDVTDGRGIRRLVTGWHHSPQDVASLVGALAALPEAPP